MNVKHFLKNPLYGRKIMRYVELNVKCFPCTVEAVDNVVENRFYRQPGMLTMVAKVVSGALKVVAK